MKDKIDKPTTYMVMLYVGNTYGVCGSHFNKDVPSVVSKEVYDYVRRNHFQRFRAWVQDSPVISPEILAEQGIILNKAPAGGDLTTEAMKQPAKPPVESRQARLEAAEEADELETAPPVDPEAIATAFGNADDDPENAQAVAEEEVIESRKGRRGRR